jgi:uncharacterized protein involved in outer membrane biogenesis
MALSRKAKIWLVIFSIPLVLLAGGIAAAKLYFTGDRLKAIIAPKLEQAAHRPVSIGSISLSIVPSLAVEIDSLMIANARGREFSATPFVTLDRLLLKVRLMSLIRGKIEITTIVIEQPRLLIEVNRWGDANYADMVSAADTTSVAAQPQGPERSRATSTGFLLSNLQIINGTVEYVDHKQNAATRIHGLNHTMRLDVDAGAREIRLEGQTSVDRLTYGTVRASIIPELRLTLDEQLLYKEDQDLLTIQKGVLAVQDMVLSASGTVSSATKKPVLALAVESDKLNIADLLSLIPREYMKKAEGLKGNGTARVKVAISGAISDSSKPDITGTITATDASIQYAQLPRPITNINLISTFERTAARQQFKLEKFSASLGNNPVTASLQMVNFDDPWITLTVAASLNLGEVKDYYPLEPGTELTGSLSADMSIAGKVSTPSTMKGSGTMEFRNVTAKTPGSRKPVQNLQGRITVSNDVIDSRKLSMLLGRSDLSLSFSLRNYLSLMSDDKKAPKASATLSLSSNYLSSADLMEDTAVAKQPSAASSRATAKEKKGGLVLPNVDMDVTATVGTLAMEKFTFSNMRALMSISNGIITLRSCTLNAFEGSVSTRGVLNLQKPDQPQFDFAMDMANLDAHAMLPKFTSFGERMSGRLTMNTTLKGSLNDTLGLVPQTLNGRGHVQVQNGALTGVKVNKQIASTLKLPDLETITFKDWANEFTVADGRIYIKDLKISALDADYVVNGSQGLDGSLDYTMSLILPEKTSSRINIGGFGGQAIDMFRDNTGRVKLDFAVAGNTDDPKVSLDTRAAQKKAEDLAKQKVKDEAKKLQDQVKSKGEDLLKDLFKKKK